MPTVARAGVLQGEIGQTVTYGPQATNWNNGSLSFAGFNTTLGQLQSVKLVVTETLSGTAKGTNTGSGTVGVEFEIVNSGQVTSNTGIDISVTNQQTTPSVTLSGGQSSGTLSMSGSTSTSQIFSSNLGFFESSYTLGASDDGRQSIIGGGGNITASFTDSGQISVESIYTYGPIQAQAPEPGTLALLAAGLFGLGFVMWRRKRGAPLA